MHATERPKGTDARLPARLNLPRIAETLSETQRHIHRAMPDAGPQDAETVARNMLSGYAYLDDLSSREQALLDFGHSARLLELNTRVLCGIDSACRAEFQAHLVATERHFYSHTRGNIGEMMDWMAGHRQLPVWEQAAGLYIRVLRQPQLFIEGNHRTGVLMASAVMMENGLPPFVLRVQSTSAFQTLTDAVTSRSRHGWRAWLGLRAERRDLATFFERECLGAYLGQGVSESRAEVLS